MNPGTADRSQTKTAGLRRVLLVDDDPLLLAALELYLSKKIPTQSVPSGEEALKRLASEQYSVIVSDMHMPAMTGVEFINQARALAPQSIYMLLTASRDNKTAVDAFNKAGVYCVIKKPCAMSDFLEFIEAAQAQYEKS